MTNSDEIDQLRREVKELRRYREIVDAQTAGAKTGAKLAGLLWIGPGLVKAIQKWLEARSKEDPVPEFETALLIAAILRRVVKVGLITGLFALVPTVLLIWQNTLMREQIYESRQQNIELVRHQRKSDLKAAISQAENELGRYLDLPFADAVPLGKAMTSPTFFERCRDDQTQEYAAVDNLMTTAYAYTRLLSELYLLDTRVMNPLSDDLSENEVRLRGAATSADVFWLAQKAVDVMVSLEKCRPEHTALFRLIRWNSQLQDYEYHRFIIPATDIKYKYDIAKTLIEIGPAVILAEDGTKVSMTIANRAARSFKNVVIRCLIARNQRDVASKLHRHGNLAIEAELRVDIQFPDLEASDIDGARALCNVDTAESTDPAVSTLN